MTSSKCNAPKLWASLASLVHKCATDLVRKVAHSYVAVAVGKLFVCVKVAQCCVALWDCSCELSLLATVAPGQSYEREVAH